MAGPAASGRKPTHLCVNLPSSPHVRAGDGEAFDPQTDTAHGRWVPGIYPLRSLHPHAGSMSSFTRCRDRARLSQGDYYPRSPGHPLLLRLHPLSILAACQAKSSPILGSLFACAPPGSPLATARAVPLAIPVPPMDMPSVAQPVHSLATTRPGVSLESELFGTRLAKGRGCRPPRE